MKKSNCILVLVVAFACNTFAQRAPSEDFGAKLLTQKWFSTTDFGKKESVFFTSVPVGKTAHWEAHFLGSDKGKFMRCDSLEQEIVAGEEESITKYQRYQCDSSATYIIRGNKLRITQSGTSYFYIISRIPLGPKEKMVKLELSVLDPQQFYR